MSQAIQEQKNVVSESWAAVRPLTRTRKADDTPYTREADVETQIAELSAQSPRIRLRRLEEAGSSEKIPWQDVRRVREETLVYFLREYVRRGDEQAAGKLGEILVDRVSAHVGRKIGAWRLSAGEADECVRDLFAQMFGNLYDLGPSAEFWEVRFWLCLDRRLYNLLELRQAVRDHEIRPGDQAGEGSEDEGENSGGTIERFLAQMIDDGASPEAAAEHHELLALFTENERLALYYCYVQGLPEESDDEEKLSAAKLLNVTGRSVRNYLTRAKEKMARWQSGQVVENGTPPRKRKAS